MRKHFRNYSISKTQLIIRMYLKDFNTYLLLSKANLILTKILLNFYQKRYIYRVIIKQSK